jgi:RecA-family ATPase
MVDFSNGHDPLDGFDVFTDSPPDWGVMTDAPEMAPETTPTRFAPIWLSDIKVEDDPPYIVDGVLPLGPTLGVTFGLPGSLKTFFVMNMLLHVAAGLPFCDREVMQGAVLYITSEGVIGVKRRLIAMREHLGLTGNVPFGLIPAMPNLGTGTADRDVLTKDIEQAIRHLKVPLRAIAIDTVRRAMPGKAENKQEDMSVLVDNCGALNRRFGAHVHAIHHTPRSDDSHGSGSNALDAATDVMIRVRREGKTLKATAMVDRMKDGPDGDNGAAFALELKPRQVGIDRNGGPIMSCAVESTEDKEAAKATRSTEKRASETKAVKTFRDAFTEALDDFGQVIQVRDSGPKVKAVDLKRVRQQFEVRYVTGETDEKKRIAAASRAFRRTIAGLPSDFATETRDGCELIWKVK